MTHPRRKHRLYAPFQVVTEGKRRRYIRLTYEVRNPVDGSKTVKTFPGAVLDTARQKYQDLLLWGVWPGTPEIRKDPNDRRKVMSIELRPVPDAEQPAA